MRLDSFERIFVALDTPDLEVAEHLVELLNGCVGGVKVGKEFFTSQGPRGVQSIVGKGLPVFLDLKFHDIPNTIVGAVKAAVDLGPKILNVHASGGKMMMQKALEASSERSQLLGVERPLILGVTVLTSMTSEELGEIGVNATPGDQVRRLSNLCRESGLDGVVCSPAEIKAVRETCGEDFIILTPGIRPQWSVPDDQKRILSPLEAITNGADYLVIGRPITSSTNPVAAVKRILSELDNDC